MKHLLDKILDNEIFTKEDGYQFIHAINDGALTNESIAGILVGIQMRGIQLQELIGFRQALLELSITPDLEKDSAIDLCGTGGDGKDTFNISTTSSLILAAMGKKVIKHGNYGVSSVCGSSNVLEEIGFTFSNDNAELQRSLKEKNICFLHAPLFHPAMKKVAPIRRNLGVRTIFNALGPLVNPVQPSHQLTGTYSLELARIYQHVLKDERTDFRVVYGMDGYDEITLTDSTRTLGKYRDEIIEAQNFGAQKLQPEELYSGASTKEAAKILVSILNGNGTNAQNSVVASNVAMTFQTFNPGAELSDQYAQSLDFIKSGQAAKHFNLN